MQEPGDAERHFLAAIRYHPHHVNAHYNLGQVYRYVNLFCRFSIELEFLTWAINSFAERLIGPRKL